MQSAADIRANVNRIQEVMKAVMKKDVHYGVIPGTPKPTLYKPGAEVLATTFRLAPEYRVEDLSGPDYVKYRVTCRLTHQTTGYVMGDGMGSCSSLEDKYKWRRPVCPEEFEETPADRKRIKFARGQGGKVYKNQQVRTEQADLDNTILKMACKRAFVAAVLNVTAASDIFSQDVEDLPPEMRETDDDPPPPNNGGRPTKSTYTDEQFKALLPQWQGLVEAGKKTPQQIVGMVSSKVDLTPDQKNTILKLGKPPSAESQSTEEWAKDYDNA